MSRFLPVRNDETPLEKHTRCWINRSVKDGYSNWKGVVKDFFYGGCESGYVTHLIYNYDCQKFAQKYLDDICELIEDYEENYQTLPFGEQEFNLVNLAWKGFELAVTKLAVENGYFD